MYGRRRILTCNTLFGSDELPNMMASARMGHRPAVSRVNNCHSDVSPLNFNSDSSYFIYAAFIFVPGQSDYPRTPQKVTGHFGP